MKGPATRRVLFLNHTGAVSGAEISLFHLVRGLQEAKTWSAAVAAPEDGRFTRLFASAGIPVEFVDLQPATRRPVSNFVNAKRIGDLVRRRRIGLVHANSFHAAKAIFLFTLLSSTPVVASVRSIEPFPRLTTMALAACAATVCVSKATAENLVGRFPHRRRDRIHVIYNGIDPALYHRATGSGDVLARFGVRTVERPVVTLLAPIVRWKGQHVFLEAAREFANRFGRGTFLLVGHEDFADQAYVTELREQARLPELDGRVYFAGFRDDVPEILAETDVVVCPSVGPDPFPRAVIEAMAAGCPVVGSGIGGIPEAIRDGETGILVPPEDAHAIARALVELAGNPERARSMGQKGALVARQQFSVKAHVERMTALYRTILSGRESP